MISLCGTACCEECPRQADCGGCLATDGRPFGGSCAAAECVHRGGSGELQRMKRALIDEVNALEIPGLRIDNLHLLNGAFVNLAYPLPSGRCVQFLDDKRVYWGNQIEQPGSDRCYGLVTDGTLLLVCEYGCNGTDPKLLLYRQR